MSKRLLSCLLLILCFSFFVAGSIGAQGGVTGTTGQRNMRDIQKEIRIPEVKRLMEDQIKGQEGEINQGHYLTGAGTGIMALGVQLVAIGAPGENGTVVDGGVIGTTTGLLADLYSNPAASGQTYIADVMNSAGMLGAQPAYAQGLGFSALNPVLSAWKVFRNIAYFFFVAIFIIIGFMIMFRQKISSQAVVTAQQAIPSIIVALLLVTFSYAIAGFLIDIMYLLMYLLVGLFGKSSVTFIDGNVFQLGVKIITENTHTVGETVGGFVFATLGGGLVGGLIGFGAGLLVSLVFAVAIMIGMFRLFFNLLKRYISIMLSVALAPLILMLGAIPGQNTFGTWFKSLVGNLAAFPILLLMLIFSDTITGNFSNTQTFATQSGGFVPPYLGGFGSGNHLVFLLGVGLLLVLSEIIDKGAQALGAGKGPLDDLVAAAGKNLRAGDEAIPIVTGGYSAIQGGITGGMAAARKRETRDWRGILRGVTSGVKEYDSSGNLVRHVGGIGPRGRVGLEFGRQIRTRLTDIEKGRFLQTDNVVRTLEEIRKNQEANNKPQTTGAPAPKRPGL